MKYKKSLNIPSTKFPMRAGLVDNTKKFKDFWEERQIYLNLSSRPEDKYYVLHDGPPYANGQIHLGHALNKILKDFILRYKALTGHRINYIPGWDTHGLPIENKLEREGNYSNCSPSEKRRKCREYALSQIEVQREQFKKLHLVCDFRKIYRTLDPEYIAKELEIFGRFVEDGLLYWALKPVAWSWSSRTALAESEIIYKEVECTSLETWFPSVSDHMGIPKDTRILIWTTTPYTLEANLALCVNPHHTYQVVEHGGHLWLGGATKIPGRVIKSVLGQHLEGMEYLNPLTGEVHRVILGDHVSDDSGTGIVHTAPGYGPEDFSVCRRYSIGAYCSLDETGHFIKGTKFPPIDGLFYERAAEVIVEWLRERGYVSRVERMVHRVGHDWRTEKPLFYRASAQWFIDIEPLKPRIAQCLDEIGSNPPWVRGKLKSLILSRDEWCLSRQRCWGTPIPILFDGGEPILDPEQINHTIALLREHGVDSWYEKEPSFFLHPETRIKGELTASRDILDVWFDSGCSWSALGERDIDLYLEGFDQLRGWFNSSAIISMAMGNGLPFRHMVSHGFVLDGNGNKMSKSKGNVIDPIGIVDRYGADILRLWLATSNHLEDIRLSDNSLENAITLYRKIRNTLFRYSLSVLGENFRPEREILENLMIPENIYIYTLFRNTYLRMRRQMDNHQFFRAIQENLSFLNLYSSWYLEICKDTLYCDRKSSREYREIVNIVHEVFGTFLIFYGIFIPQTAEEAYGYLNGGESVVLETLPEAPETEVEPAPMWGRFFDLRDRVYVRLERLKEEGKIANTTEAAVVIPRERMMEGINLRKCLNVGQVIVGDEFGVRRCTLPKCERCGRHMECGGELCLRCQLFIEEVDGEAV